MNGTNAKNIPTLKSRGLQPARRSLLGSAAILLTIAVWSFAQTPFDNRAELAQTGVRFAAVDVYIDSGETPLAAFQFELNAGNADVKIVGVEGGEHPAFARPPYYDPKALHDEGRIIIAAFNTGDDLPTGQTRIARIHVRIIGEQQPEYGVELIVAASPAADEIDATTTIKERSDHE